MVVGARQSFRFFRKNTWFLENNRALSESLNYYYQITKKSVHKTQLYISHARHLNIWWTPKNGILKNKRNLRTFPKLQNLPPRSALIKALVRPHLDYSDILYDQVYICPFNKNWNLFSIMPSWPYINIWWAIMRRIS